MKKNLFYFILLGFSLIAFISSCPAPTEPSNGVNNVAATNITINGGNFTNSVGSTGTLTATVLPANHTDGEVTWTSSDTDKLTISSNGEYRAIAPGSVKITASIGTHSNAITVTITLSASNITINGGNFTNDVDATGTLTATVLPANHTDGGEITWTSSDINKLTISSTGEYRAIAPGSVKITASIGNISNYITATILNSATNITIDSEDFSVYNGVNGTLTATTLPPRQYKHRRLD